MTPGFRHLENDGCSQGAAGTGETLVRQAKLGTSCKVKVLAGEGQIFL